MDIYVNVLRSVPVTHFASRENCLAFIGCMYSNEERLSRRKQTTNDIAFSQDTICSLISLKYLHKGDYYTEIGSNLGSSL